MRVIYAIRVLKVLKEGFQQQKILRYRNIVIEAIKQKQIDSAKYISMFYQKFLERKNKMLDKRVQNYCRYSMKLSALAIQNNIRFESKLIILKYLRDNKEISVFNSKVGNYWNQILKIRTRWKTKMEEKRKR